MTGISPSSTRIVFNIYFVFFFISISISIYALITLNLYMILAIIIAISFQKLFGKRNQFYIKFICKYVKPYQYFRKFERIFQQEPPQSGCIFAHHPHSVYALALLIAMNYGNDAYSKMTALGSRFILNTPFAGFVLRLWGVQTVNQNNMEKLMKQRKNIGLVPGGFEQATITTPKALRVFIQSRKGFIKLCLKYGYKVCPVVVMNQHKAFYTIDKFKGIRLLLNKIKMPGVIPIGRFLFFAFNDLDIYNIVGKAISLPRIQKPSKEDVEHWHRIYVEELRKLYEKYKHLNENVPLEIY